MIHDLEETIRKAMAIGGPGTGYVISTGATIMETVEALRCCHVDPTAFDALICSSGSQVCYPWRDLLADTDYNAHVEYRWPAEHVKSAVPRLAMMDGAEGDDLTVDEQASSSHCYAYSLKAGAKVSPFYRHNFFL